MSTAHAVFPAGYLSDHVAARPHCFIETSGKLNEFVKIRVINLAERGFRQVGKRLYGARVTVMGLAYKMNDPRESPAIKIIEELANLGADVRVYDPFVPSLATKAGVFTSVGSVEEALSGAECVIFLVDYDAFRGDLCGDGEGAHGLAGGCGREEPVCWRGGNCVSGDWERSWFADHWFRPYISAPGIQED